MSFSIKFLLLLAVAFNLIIKNAMCQHYAVETQRMNEAFIGIPNPISVVVEGYACKKILVTTDNGTLEKIGSCEYYFTPAEIGTGTIKIFSKDGNRFLGKRALRVKNLPVPTAYVDRKTHGQIAANILRVQLGIVMMLDGFDFDIKFNVRQYFLTIIGADGRCSTFGPATNAFFTEPMKAALQNVNGGDRLIITGIKVINYSKEELIVAPIDLTIE